MFLSYRFLIEPQFPASNHQALIFQGILVVQGFSPLLLLPATPASSAPKSNSVQFLQQALRYARAGDTIVVWRLDRLSRSLKDLIEMVTLLESKGIGLKSLHDYSAQIN